MKLKSMDPPPRWVVGSNTGAVFSDMMSQEQIYLAARKLTKKECADDDRESYESIADAGVNTQRDNQWNRQMDCEYPRQRKFFHTSAPEAERQVQQKNDNGINP
jgi:hypothetical protein